MPKCQIGTAADPNDFRICNNYSDVEEIKKVGMQNPFACPNGHRWLSMWAQIEPQAAVPPFRFSLVSGGKRTVLYEVCVDCYNELYGEAPLPSEMPGKGRLCFLSSSQQTVYSAANLQGR
jgi:hypothetical protein